MLMSYQNFSHSDKFVATHVTLGVKTQTEHKYSTVFATHTKQHTPQHKQTNSLRSACTNVRNSVP